MKVVIAPDAFKECMPASAVAQALAEGVLSAAPDAVVDLCPMADGGPGTVEAMVAATGGSFLTADVFDPLGAPVRARFGMLGARPLSVLPGELGLSAAVADAGSEKPGGVAVIEMAAASGLELVPPEMRDPMRTTTFGTGQLIAAALDADASEVIVGLGGSATVDGGCGCAQALGVSFLGRDGKPCVCGISGGSLKDIARIDLSLRDARVMLTRIRVACDVTNPLTGPNGAAAVFGPQKGATPEMVERLEQGLAHLAAIVRRDLGVDVEHMSGAGAAGGLGAGLVAFAGATLQRGFGIVADAVNLSRRLAGADLCITGEGRLDGSSLSGKTAFGVAQLCAQANVPVVCIPGQAEPGGAAAELFNAVYPLADEEISVRQARQRANELLKIRAAQAVRALANGKL